MSKRNKFSWSKGESSENLIDAFEEEQRRLQREREREDKAREQEEKRERDHQRIKEQIANEKREKELQRIKEETIARNKRAKSEEKARKIAEEIKKQYG